MDFRRLGPKRCDVETDCRSLKQRRASFSFTFQFLNEIRADNTLGGIFYFLKRVRRKKDIMSVLRNSRNRPRDCIQKFIHAERFSQNAVRSEL
jgi:hypothetical protein